MAISITGATTERRSSTRIPSTTRRTSGISSLVSRSTAVRRSASSARRAADEHHVADGSAKVAAERLDRGERSLVERILLEDDVEPRPGLPALRLPDPRHPVGRPRGLERRVGPAGLRDEHDGRSALACREGLLEQLLALNGLDRAAEGVGGRQVVVEAERAERQHRRARAS